jgi:hypothetical protein
MINLFLADCGTAIVNGGVIEPVSSCNMLCQGNSSELYVDFLVSELPHANLVWQAAEVQTD